MTEGAENAAERLNDATREALHTVLKCIIPAMFKAQEPWAVVGSTASVLQGFPGYQPPDIDLATTRDGAYVIEGCLSALGDTVRPVSYSVRQPYASHFGIFRVNGVKVEVMGDLVIRCTDGVIDLNDHWARWSDQVRVTHVENLHAPLVALEWQILANALLGRMDRVEALAACFAKTGYDRPFLEHLLEDHRHGERTIGAVREALGI